MATRSNVAIVDDNPTDFFLWNGLQLQYEVMSHYHEIMQFSHKIAHIPYWFDVNREQFSSIDGMKIIIHLSSHQRLLFKIDQFCSKLHKVVLNPSALLLIFENVAALK